MKKDKALQTILVINAGSSSIKFAQYRATGALKSILHGKIDRIGLSGTSLTYKASTEPQDRNIVIPTSDRRLTVKFLIDWLEERIGIESILAVGHRVVHGMEHTAPELITENLLNELRSFIILDPEHMIVEIQLIEAIRQRYPQLPQFACFDTVFHMNMPRVAKLLALPRRFDSKGIRRYGFHGLSFSYLMDELVHLDDPAASKGRIILAHLGNGASLAAVRDGQSLDTSMGFTPAGGLPMGTRTGDLDPGILSYLLHTEQLTATHFNRMIHQESGLLGVSEISSDMQDLLSKETTDVRAAEAVELFCYQAKKWIGSFSAALGGVDTLVFAGGIGENAPLVRSRICQNLGFLGIELDESLNEQSSSVISSNDSKVKIRIIRTDEELMIARSVQSFNVLNTFSQKETL